MAWRNDLALAAERAAERNITEQGTERARLVARVAALEKRIAALESSIRLIVSAMKRKAEPNE